MSFVGCVVEPIDEERSALFGSCFALGDADHFVTADHVIDAETQAARGRGVDNLHVLGPAFEPTPVEAIDRHPSADIAVLRVSHDHDVEPFREIGDCGAGAGVRLFGGSGAGEELVTEVIGLGRSWAPRWRAGAPAGWRHGFEAYVLEAAPGPGFCGSPVLSLDDEQAIGVLTQTATFDGVERGLALRLCALEPWLETIWIEAVV